MSYIRDHYFGDNCDRIGRRRLPVIDNDGVYEAPTAEQELDIDAQWAAIRAQRVSEQQEVEQ